MSETDQFRQYAEEAKRWVRQSKTENEKQVLIELARMADACNPALAREGKTVTRAVQCAAAYSGAEDENRTAGRIGDEPTCWSQ